MFTMKLNLSIQYSLLFIVVPFPSTHHQSSEEIKQEGWGDGVGKLNSVKGSVGSDC